MPRVRQRHRTRFRRISTPRGIMSLSRRLAWIFPAVLTLSIIATVWAVVEVTQYHTSPLGEPLVARITWAVPAMLFLVLFAFALITCNVLMFVCGDPRDARIALLLTTAGGLLSVAISVYCKHDYLGPPEMHDLLQGTAFCLPGVETLTAVFNGLSVWAALLVVATSSVIARYRIEDTSKSVAAKEEELSRQLRGARILMYTAAALLIAGVAEVAALHKWPALDTAIGLVCPKPLPSPWNGLIAKGFSDYKTAVDTSATAISSAVGAVFSLLLTAAYLPLGILLRQRAYRIIRPYAKTEAWLGLHGFSLQPTQQLAKVLLIFSPLLAGGPLSYLVTLLSQ